MEPIKKILPSVVAKHGFSKALRAQRVCEAAAKVLESLWGVELARYIHPVSFIDDLLKCEAYAPSAQQELKVQQVRFINEINRAVGEKCVKRLVIMIKFVA